MSCCPSLNTYYVEARVLKYGTLAACCNTEMRSKRVGAQSKFVRYIKCPFRALARARDLYMQSLAATGGGCVTYGNAMGCPTPHIASLPRSASVNSGFRSADEQLRDLMRLTPAAAPARAGGLRRSKTVAHGRINEEDDRMGLLGEFVYHRNKTYAHSSTLKLLP
ncbi:hypothetical protein SASPL_144855 [Salvia splendens]|uniref:Uncharacterized protein n=1 Tax=Salvia splendens TaxID=180675 RepID=A0A8X8Z765_SALSN|nr:hypothetical protein SASPL_144855 [Salvia splendens]